MYFRVFLGVIRPPNDSVDSADSVDIIFRFLDDCRCIVIASSDIFTKVMKILDLKNSCVDIIFVFSTDAAASL